MILALLLGLGALIYSNSWNVPFQFDAIPRILKNWTVYNLSNIPAIWNFNEKTRFLCHLSFALNNCISLHQVFGFHLLNFAIHMSNSFLVYFLVLLLLSTPQMLGKYSQNASHYLSVFSALIFLSHPLQTQAVTYIFQRSTSLATFFYLGTIIFYLKERLDGKKVHFYLAFAMAVLAMFCKEIAFTLPLMLGLIECLFFGFSGNKRKIFTKLFPFLLLLIIIPCLTLMSSGNTLYTSPHQFFPNPLAQKNVFSRLEYLLTEFNVLCTYLRLLLFPIHQNVDYDYPIAHSLLEPKTLLCFLLLSGLFLMGIWMIKKNRLVAFTLFWFFLTLSVESTIIPLNDVIAEHRMYLPLAGCAIFLATTLFFFLKTPLFVAIAAMMILTFSSLTYARNYVWRTEVSLWEDVMQKSPDKKRGYINLPRAYLEKKDFEKAREYYEKIIEKDPLDPRGYYNLGILYNTEGDKEKALMLYNKAIEIDPQQADVLNNLSVLYSEKNDVDRAIANLQKAIKIKPYFAIGHYNLGVAYQKKGDIKNSVTQFIKVMRINPYYAPAYCQLGIIFKNNGKPEEAVRFLKKSCALDPTYPDPVLALGEIYLQQGDIHLVKEQIKKMEVIGQKEIAQRLYRLIQTNKENPR